MRNLQFAAIACLGLAHFLFSVDVPLAAETPLQSAPATVADDTQESLEDDTDTEADSEAESDDVFDLSIEQLRRTQLAPALEEVVTTVARQKSVVGRSPAAVYVLSGDMIRRSGARTIPEALRLVPGLQIAHRDSNKWVVASRGFASRFTKNLLVLIDGRIVYTPVFAGTYWDVQDVVLEDIDRIEVIRGPGATLWGPNAVNGVINIITKSTKDTTGVYANAGGGTQEDGFSTVRVGGCRGDLAWRGYFKWFERDRGTATGGPTFDDWRQKRGGFRTDWTPTCRDTVTFQGDVYEGQSGTTAIGFTPDEEVVQGYNLLSRWTREVDENSDQSLQVYFDVTDRSESVLSQHVEVFDVDYQYRFPIGRRNNVIWGVTYRRAKDFLPTVPPEFIRFVPAGTVRNLYSGFIQDEITLREESLYLTLGTKLEHNDFTGFEVQPNIRLLCQLSERQVAWGSIARAVRTPARFTQDAIVRSPSVAGPSILGPSPLVGSEELIAYEVGYRAQPMDRFSWDLALFYNVYEGLESLRFRDVEGPFPRFTLVNDMCGHGYGLELTCKYQINDRWKLTGWYAFQQLALKEAPTLVPRTERFEGSSPHNQAFLMSSWNLGSDVELDLMARYVDELPSQFVPSYLSLDLRLGWQPTQQLELSVVGQNLLERTHLEFGRFGPGRPDPPVGVPMGIYGMVQYRY